MTAGALQRARLVPEDGSAELPFHYNPSSMTLATGAQWRSVDRFAATYAEEMASFVEVARGQRPPEATLADAVHAVRIAQACLVSRREGRPVDLAEIAGSAEGGLPSRASRSFAAR